MIDKVLIASALVLAAVYAVMTEQVTTLPFGDPLGPKAFPRILTVVLILAVVLLLMEMRAKRKAAPASPAVAAAPGNRRVIAGAIGLTALYLVLFEPIGFVLSSSAYLYAMTTFFNPGQRVANALVSLLLPLGCYLVFNHLLGVQLAPGLLPL